MMDHVPFKHRRTTLERAEKFISPDYFTDINLRSRLYSSKAPLTSISHYAAPDRITFAEAVKGSYQPASIGQAFGPVWSTHWFQLQINVPAAWIGQEVHLLWNSGSEAMVWVAGEARQGLNGTNDRTSYILSHEQKESSELQYTVYIEMACNHLFGIGNVAIVKVEDEKKTFTLAQAEVAVFDRDVYNLILDIETLHAIAKEFPEDNQRGYQALFAVNEMVNQINVREKSTYRRAQEIAQTFFQQKNGDSQHTVYAMGHAHIDTAWLWPYAETIRKCARSWTCTLRLMERYPELIFTCSQAQQYAWVKQHYPSIWRDICHFVQKGQFVPVGGTWVEMDGNIPSGEACVRQFLYGQNFFLQEFGLKCKEFWLPDTFGYSAQFPQIMQHCGVTRFLTQKLSWSLVNKFPHSSFHWEGIDGSSVLAHFPPGESYTMTGTVKELLKTVRNNQDKGRSNCSAFLYGYGDGGHGPREDMLGRVERLKNCDGLPRVKMSSSDDFFSTLERESTNLLCRWRGELYLELHNGTYTTWAKVKKYNRQCEILLTELETISVMTCVANPKFEYPRMELDRMWKLLLLNQFHDVLPGSSITLVFQDAINYYKDIVKTSCQLISDTLQAWVGQQAEATDRSQLYVVNTQAFHRHELVQVPSSAGKSPATKRRKVSNNSVAAVGDASSVVEVMVPPLCIKPLADCLVMEKGKEGNDVVRSSLHLDQRDDHYVLSNGHIKAVIDPVGRLTSLKCWDKNTGSWSKEAVDCHHPANQFLLYDDVPLYWDAWDIMDYHLETRKPVVTAIQQTEEGENICDTRISLQVSLKLSEQSYLKQEIRLDAGSPYISFHTEVTWFENRKCLKVEFPTSIHTMEATYDIQSGFLCRPNHYNTSWDSARFEVCGHKWADLSEYNFGVALINNCKYGHSAVDGILRLSLLRSPKTPDPKADMGVHTFSYAVMPHEGTFQEADVIQAALSFNCPLRVVSLGVTDQSSQSLFQVNTKQVVLQTVKMAEDASQTIIVRLHETYGGSTKVELVTSLPLKQVQVCNGLEEPLADGDKEVHVELLKLEQACQIGFIVTPFQLVSLRCSF